MILLIDNYDSFTYNLYQIMAMIYPEILVKRHDKISLEDIQTLQPLGIVLSPGPGRPENAGICIELIQSIVTGSLSSIPLLGICLGHQALVSALGGKVVHAPETIHGKPDQIYHNKTHLYQHVSNPFQVGRYHSLIASREHLPSSLQVEAENQHQLIMGVRHRRLPLYGMQFHPESILTPEGPELIRAFIMICQKWSRPDVA